MINIGEICLRGEQFAFDGSTDTKVNESAGFGAKGFGIGLVEGNGRMSVHGEPGSKRRQAAARVEKAINYMLHNLNTPISMSALSKLSGISTSNFYYFFKLATGSTPNDFFIRAKMRHACKLLSDPNLSVKEVAFLLGYDDQFYFSRVFKAVHHVPPSHYRINRGEFDGRETALATNGESMRMVR